MISLRRARLSCTAISLLLAAVWGLGYGWFQPSEEYGITLAVIGALPLLCLAPGAYQGKTLATAVLGFLSLFYLAHGFTELMANPEVRLIATLTSLLALGLFLSAGHTLRVQNIHRGQNKDQQE